MNQAPHPAILTLNAGSSSVKFALFPVADDLSQTPALSGEIDGIGITAAHLKIIDRHGTCLAETQIPPRIDATISPHATALAAVLDWLSAQGDGWQIIGVGHRVVHGGAKFFESAVLSAPTLTALEEFIPLAPLHQPHNLAGIHAVTATMPDVPQIACFDTAFHRTQPAVAQTFPLPREITDAGVRRYGFHGLSYEYIADALPQVMPEEDANGRIIVAHLGNGASLCAMRERHSIATSMGFSPLDGLMMGTRCGSLDPGVLLYLMQTRKMDAKALETLLYRQSGLLGVSGISADMRHLLDSSDPHAGEAIDLFCYRMVREVGSLVAALGGLDTLVFTGGIGTYAVTIRQRIVDMLGWLGLELDAGQNATGPGQHPPTATGLPVAWRISTSSSRVGCWVIPTNEEGVIAQHTARHLRKLGLA